MRRASGFGETASPCDMHASICQPLTARCNAQVYAKNIFHILGIPTNATARDVRRRREDLDSAHIYGKSAWDAAFPHLFPGRTIPSKDEVDEAFLRLEDPLSRLIDEFFWFWPRPVNGARDDGIFAMLQGNWSVANGLWAQARHSTASEEDALIAEHNLGVFWSLKAISAEFEESAVSSDGEEADFCWEKAFKHWEAVSDSDGFWDAVSGRVLDIADPRLTTGFVQNMRQEFPIAFDRINADFVVHYAKKGKESHANRHFAYIKKTHAGMDDIDTTLGTLVSPLEKTVELALAQAQKATKDNPSTALDAATKLLDSTREVVAVLRHIPYEFPQRHTLLDSIARQCNSCQVIYANATGDWESCLSVLTAIIDMPQDIKLKALIESNHEVCKKNAVADKELNTCFLCGKRLKQSEHHDAVLKMYGNVRRSQQVYGQVEYQKKEVRISCCINCKIGCLRPIPISSLIE